MGWGSGAVELPYLISPSEALHANFDRQTVEILDWSRNEGSHVDALAAQQDVCLVFINSDAGEGYLNWNGVKGDRNDLYPQKGGDELVRQVASNCKNTVVVLHTVGPTILEKWIDMPRIKAVLVAHLPGQESGNALADVIFGDVNPSGRLPYTIAQSEKDYGPSSGILYYPNRVVPQQNFSEGLYIDYRYFDKHNITPRYEFGYGLSYSSFKLNSLMVKPLGTSGQTPEERPEGIEPPHIDDTLPSPETALWPKDFRKLKQYVYPYIDTVSDIEKSRYPYPKGYDTLPQPSQAGGGEGGNPDLFRPAVSIQATLTNAGPLPGACVVQLYISYPANVTDSDGGPVDMPVKVLRNFEKIYVRTKERKPLTMELTRRDLSYWDVKRQNWVMPDGDFTIYVGFSSRDLPERTPFTTSLNLKVGIPSGDWR